MPDNNCNFGCSNKNTQQVVELLKRAADATRTAGLARQKSQPAVAAMKSEDKDAMFAVLQAYMREYGGFINQMTFLTGICVVPVTKEEYERMTTDDIRDKLNLMVCFVYAKEAISGRAQKNFKDYLKSILKREHLVPDNILALL